MSFNQLNPPIPLRSEKASGYAIAVIDYSPEYDLIWVIIDDHTGEIWAVSNRDVRAYQNFTLGRNLNNESKRNLFNQARRNRFKQRKRIS